MGESNEVEGVVPDRVPARMVNQFVYCPRLFHLQWAQSEFVSSDDVEEGLYVHRVVDTEKGALPQGNEEWGNRRVTSVSLSSDSLGLTATLDLVEAGRDPSDGVVPVDYKKGRPDRGGRAWPGDRAQVLIQALLLVENGYEVDHAEIWYAETRQRVVVPFDADAELETRSLLEQLWSVARDPKAPPPLVNSPKCPKCALVGICLPDETSAIRRAGKTGARPARVMALDPDTRPLYVTQQGATLGVRGGRACVFDDTGQVSSFRLIDISQVSLFGNVNVTPQLVRELMSRDVPILWFTRGGWFSGMAQGLPSKNVSCRIAQYQAGPESSLELARAMIAGKIRNSRTLLRRNSRQNTGRVCEQLAETYKKARQADSSESLLGYEGTAARLYFAHFDQMISEAAKVDCSQFAENGRARRPPPDPVNAALSFCYALLTKDVTVTLHAVGLDPYFGVLHRPRFGRPALALDLAEEFRPLIAESVALQAFNNGELRESDFKTSGGGCQLEASGRKVVLRCYERRMDQEIVHPRFGYRVNYRRAIEVQARLLAAAFVGEFEDYTPFITR